MSSTELVPAKTDFIFNLKKKDKFLTLDEMTLAVWQNFDASAGREETNKTILDRNNWKGKKLKQEIVLRVRRKKIWFV